MKLLLRNLALFVSGAVVLVAFQNCGQPGSLSQASSSLDKAGGPLVVDVVGEMQNQLPSNQTGSNDDTEDSDDKKCNKKKNHDVVYNNDLENVLQNHSCQNNAKKVLICHYPRGNPAARHEICIGRPALMAHIRHSASSSHVDHLGTCPDDDEG
jgi:hypothetical protein